MFYISLLNTPANPDFEHPVFGYLLLYSQRPKSKPVPISDDWLWCGLKSEDVQKPNDFVPILDIRLIYHEKLERSVFARFY